MRCPFDPDVDKESQRVKYSVQAAEAGVPFFGEHAIEILSIYFRRRGNFRHSFLGFGNVTEGEQQRLKGLFGSG
jgi:hypothetical protein